MSDDPQDVCDSSSVLSPRIAGFIGDESTMYFLFIEQTIVFNSFPAEGIYICTRALYLPGGGHIYMLLSTSRTFSPSTLTSGL